MARPSLVLSGKTKYCSIKCKGLGERNKKVTKEKRKKMSIAHKNQIAWNKGRKLNPDVEKICQNIKCSKPFIVPYNRINTAKYCSRKCLCTCNGIMVGKLGLLKGIKRAFIKHPWNIKISEKRRGKPSLKIRGENNWNWKGGISSLNNKISSCINSMEWTRDVYKRDDWTCVKCDKRGGDLCAHHIRPFSVIIKQNNIKSLEDADKCDELWDINNGQTLCKNCHKKTHNPSIM